MTLGNVKFESVPIWVIFVGYWVMISSIVPGILQCRKMVQRSFVSMGMG